MLILIETNKGRDVVQARAVDMAELYVRTLYDGTVEINRISTNNEEVEQALAIGATLHDIEE